MSPHPNGLEALEAAIEKTRNASRLRGPVVGQTVARLWFTPWRVPLGERALAKQESWLEPTRPLSLDVGEHRLSGYEGGEGPTVLLVHGWGDSSRSMGAFAAPAMEVGYRVVAFDMPGHGETSGGETDALKIAAAVRGAADALGWIHAVIAHSMGAHATMLAMREGLAVEKVVFLSPSVRLASALAPFAEMFDLSDMVIAELRAEIERRYGPTVWTELAGDALVRSNKTPALVLHDPDDPQVPFADAERLVRAWPSARLETAEGLGHTGILRDQKVVERAIAFLSADRTEERRVDRVPSSV